ncbi:MAG: hypothetical protein Q9171_007017 [Xanthocarpia ochracea]
MSNKANNISGGSMTGKYASERTVAESQRGSQFQSNGSDPQKSYHSVQRNWSSPGVLHTQREQQPQSYSTVSPMTQRWMTESPRNQPWNGVAGYYTSSTGKK